MVLDRDGDVLADLVHHGDRWLAAAGGRGGQGNARFLSNRRRAPDASPSRARWARSAGCASSSSSWPTSPSSGSPTSASRTLISRISAAKPKIADYPFTTLEPNLGVVRLDDGFEIVVADIPGLIEGASEGEGLGHQFLRHIERARALVLLIDLAGGRRHDRTPERAGARPARSELEALPARAARPAPGGRRLRADVARPRARDGRPDRRRRPRARSASRRSPATGLPRSSGRMADAVREARAAEPEPEAFVVHRPVRRGLPGRARRRRQLPGASGRAAERAVALSDLTNLEALDYAHAPPEAARRRQGPRPGRRPGRRHRRASAGSTLRVSSED